MARKFLTPIDLGKNELQNARIQNLAADPSTPVAGQVYYNTVANEMRIYNGTAFEAIGLNGVTATAAEINILAGTLVSATELNYVDGVTSGIQGQLNLKAPLASPTFTGTVSLDTGVAIVFEGATADAFETTLTVVDPTADRTISLPNATTTLVGQDTTDTLSNKTLTTPIINGPTITAVGQTPVIHGILLPATHGITYEGATDDAFETLLTVVDPTADQTVSLPNATGTVALVQNKLHDFAVATASVDLNSQKITNLATPTVATDAANKGYVDAAVVGIEWKPSVRVATTANGTLATAFANGQVVDGITLVTGNRILIKDQTTGTENGLYTVNATGAPTRSTDADTNAELTASFAVFVEEGTANADSGYTLTNDGTVTIGTTALTFTQFTGLGQITAGNGLTKTANTIDVVGGTGIIANANDVAIDTAVVVRKYAVAIGDGTATSITVTHNLNTRDVTVGVYSSTSTYDEVECDIMHTTVNTVTLLFSVAPTAGQYRAVVHG